MTSLHYRKAHRAQYSHLPRMTSFIGTSNRRDLLNDPTGSRRYLWRGMNAHQFGKTLTLIGAERVHTVNGNVYRVVEVE